MTMIAFLYYMHLHTHSLACRLHGSSLIATFHSVLYSGSSLHCTQPFSSFFLLYCFNLIIVNSNNDDDNDNNDDDNDVTIIINNDTVII